MSAQLHGSLPSTCSLNAGRSFGISGWSIAISEILLNDKHDLIHKAVGWMLREVGKKDEPELEKFLKKYYKKMPRTMLRYSIERLNEKKRKFYMKKD